MRVFQSIFDRYPSETMDYVVRLFLFVGAWPLVPGEKHIYLRLIQIMPLFGLVCCALHFILILYNISSKLDNLMLLSEDVVIVIYLAKTVMRLAIGAFKKPLLVDVVNRLNAFTHSYNDPTEHDLFKRYSRRAQWFATWYSFFRFFLNFVFTIEPLVDGVKMFPGHTKFPIPNSFDSPQYECLYVISIFMSLVFSGAIAAGDVFFVSALIFLTLNYKILQHKLECSRECACKKVLADKQRELEDIVETMDESCVVSMDALQDRATIEVVAARQQLPAPKQMNVTDILTTAKMLPEATANRDGSDHIMNKIFSKFGRFRKNARRARRIVTDTRPVMTSRQRRGRLIKQKNSMARDINLEMDRHLDECIQYHLDLNRFTDHIQEEVTHLLFFEMVVGALVICIYLLQLSQAPLLSIKFAVRFSYLMVNVVSIFAICWAANELSVESSLVSDAMYFSDWVEASRAFKVKMRIVMSRSLRPIVISGASFLPYSLEAFTNMMNSAYSYYNVALTMKEKK